MVLLLKKHKSVNVSEILFKSGETFFTKILNTLPPGLPWSVFSSLELVKMSLKVITYYNESFILFSTYSFQYAKIPLQFFRDQSGVVKFYGSFAFNRKRNVLELEIKQDYTSPGTQKYVVRFFLDWPFVLLSSQFNIGRAYGWRAG